MSALPGHSPAPAAAPLQAHFELLTPALLDVLMPVEDSAYPNPWTRGNFLDALAAGYQCQLLMAGPGQLLGYFIAMRGVGEAHLLNLTVAPAHQRQGWAQLLLDALDLWARSQDAAWLWLEVRVSNQRALAIYERHGYRRVGERKNYYPGAGGLREDAIVMCLPL